MTKKTEELKALSGDVQTLYEKIIDGILNIHEEPDMDYCATALFKLVDEIDNDLWRIHEKILALIDMEDEDDN